MYEELQNEQQCKKIWKEFFENLLTDYDKQHIEKTKKNQCYEVNAETLEKQLEKKSMK